MYFIKQTPLDQSVLGTGFVASSPRGSLVLYRKCIRVKETDSLKLDKKQTSVFFAFMYFLSAPVRQTAGQRYKLHH